MFKPSIADYLWKVFKSVELWCWGNGSAGRSTCPLSLMTRHPHKKTDWVVHICTAATRIGFRRVLLEAHAPGDRDSRRDPDSETW